MKSPAVQPAWVRAARTALLVIDCQVDFAQSQGAMGRLGLDVAAPQAAVAKAELLVAAARAAGVACVFSRLVTVPDTLAGREARMRRGGQEEPRLCVEGTSGVDFVGPLPAPGELVISKHRYSVFPGTGLAEALQARGVDTLVLCGLTTECCVQSSAWDAFERDFHVFIVTDACAAYEEELHRAALQSLELSGAVLAETQKYLSCWNIQ